MAAGTELRIGVIGAGGRGGLAAYAHEPEQGTRVAAGADGDVPPVPDHILECFRAEVEGRAAH